MMRRPAVHQLQVHVRCGRMRERAEEILHQFGLKVADARAPKS